MIRHPHHLRRQQSGERQRGVATIEFALVFTVIFAVFWSLVCYAVPLIILQVMNRATAEGSRAAALVLTGATAYPTVAAYQAAATIEATNEANRQIQAISILTRGMSLVPTVTFGTDVNGSCPTARPNCVLTVQLQILNYSTVAPMKPLLNLPGIGSIPTLPTNLTSTSRVALI
jgi:Flp pilus assembly protein TadG